MTLSTDKQFFSFGDDLILDSGVWRQMQNVMDLHVVHSGALMPDAHQGYGMPIGGVAAAKNAVIPYAVGVDIGCRMHLTFFPEVGQDAFETMRDRLRSALLEGTHFGGKPLETPRALRHAAGLFDGYSVEWATIARLLPDKALKDRAVAQIGTSGGGNHFVEWGLVTLTDLGSSLEGWPDLNGRSCLALLSHSGSRAMGYEICGHFCKIAGAMNPLAGEMKELSWLDMSTQEGRDYWKLMHLAGEFSRLNHEIIHEEVFSRVEGLGEEVRISVSNHHNFAWEETLEDGSTAYVHRKGATPASSGMLGIIPGSMATPGFIVRGKGNSASLNSASHGSGRALSRGNAKRSITSEDMSSFLSTKGVELIAGGVDEAPQAYKDIHSVMAQQSSLVDTLGQFEPKIVRMAPPRDFDPKEGS
jgi:tRNA-splicing ligase RtcB